MNRSDNHSTISNSAVFATTTTETAAKKKKKKKKKKKTRLSGPPSIHHRLWVSTTVARVGLFAFT